MSPFPLDILTLDGHMLARSVPAFQVPYLGQLIWLEPVKRYDRPGKAFKVVAIRHRLIIDEGLSSMRPVVVVEKTYAERQYGPPLNEM